MLTHLALMREKNAAFVLNQPQQQFTGVRTIE